MLKERMIINDEKNKLQIQEYLMKLLKNENCSQVDVRRTPLGTRIVAYTTTPGLIIGSKGSGINKIKDILRKEFGLENPQIDIQKIQNPLLDSKFVAKRLADLLEKGYNYKKLGNVYTQKIMSSGALGCEIIFAGKLSGEKSRRERFKKGYLIKSGHQAEVFVSKASAEAIPKLGIINITVSIIVNHPEREVREKLNKIINGDAEKKEKPKSTESKTEYTKEKSESKDEKPKEEKSNGKKKNAEKKPSDEKEKQNNVKKV